MGRRLVMGEVAHHRLRPAADPREKIADTFLEAESAAWTGTFSPVVSARR